MAYRGRPGVRVTQEFLAAAPALAAVSLHGVVVGPAYQIVDDEQSGTYSGAEQSYAYSSLLGGAVVDVEELSSEEMFPAIKKPISLSLKNVVLEILASQTTGAVAGTTFSDATTDIFENVLAGDVVVIEEQTGVEIVAAQTNGQTTDTAGQRNRLTAGTASQFENVKVGDTVNVTGGTNTIIGTFTVSIKLSDDVLILDSDVNDGVGPSTDVAYSITGDRGTANAGEYQVRSVTDVNTLELVSPMPEENEAPLSYYIKRALSNDVSVERVASHPGNGFVADEDAITLPVGYTVDVGGVDFPVLEADVYSSYRAFRSDLSSEVRTFETLADVNALFGGADQIVPANPLAYALSIMKQNTVSPVKGVGLPETFLTDESLAYTTVASDALTAEEVYAIAPLTFNGAVHTMLRNHVEQLSLPDNKLERVVIISSLLSTIAEVQAENTTSTELVGARSIVSTQVDGSGDIGAPTVLEDATADQFLNVEPGDTVVIVSGTGVTAGEYTVASKQSSNAITLDSSFITAGSPTDIQYYIARKDGLGADGVTFYDRDAAFVTNGTAVGHYIEILTGSYAGKWKIAEVTSDKQVVLSTAMLGVTTLVTGVNYRVIRDLSKTEQAENIAGYSESFASRRVVHVWPDVVKAPIGQSVEDLPGYFLGAAVAGLTAGLPPQQGLTNLTVSGFIGFDHSTKYFSELNLDAIADGGTMIYIQEGPEQPLLCRHQMTTDRSTIKFQEYSVTKNVDFIAKFLRDAFRGPIGRYNIVDTTLDLLKTTAQASINFLRDYTKLPFIGGNIRSGTLLEIAEDPNQIDTVKIRFSFQVPIPLNYIDITIEV